MDGQSLNISAEKLAQLQAIFPEVFSEGKIDFQRLKTALGDNLLASDKEHYQLSWAGKTEAAQQILQQTTATLRQDTILFIQDITLL